MKSDMIDFVQHILLSEVKEELEVEGTQIVVLEDGTHVRKDYYDAIIAEYDPN